MLRIALIVWTLTVVGCANTKAERAEAFEREAPQLVAACNASFGAAGRRTRDGIQACGRLANKKSLGLVDPTAASAYTRFANSRTVGTGQSNAGSVRNSPSPIPGPGGSSQSIQ
jgi:hypothetical protein